ncbi:MAG: ABC transporter permease [Planctomycetes bacterium]|nr:ABC transporter permease [Planctomycetota bacterium]
MLVRTVRSDVRARYAGSVLGLAWLVLYPLLFLGAYSLVYIYIFNARFGLYKSHEYVLHIFCGLVPFLAFTESLAAGVPSVTGNSNLIKNTLFPIELVPVKVVLASQCTHLAAAGILFVALGLCGRLTVYAALFPVVFLAQLLLSMGVIWVLSSLNVFVRDLQNAVAILTLLLMLVSPIAYSVSDLPPGVHRLLLLNPLYYIVVSWQEILMAGHFPGRVLATLCIISVASACLGLRFFTRMKRVFADNV